jgi:hypothetical protein
MKGGRRVKILTNNVTHLSSSYAVPLVLLTLVSSLLFHASHNVLAKSSWISKATITKTTT